MYLWIYALVFVIHVVVFRYSTKAFNFVYNKSIVDYVVPFIMTWPLGWCLLILYGFYKLLRLMYYTVEYIISRQWDY